MAEATRIIAGAMSGTSADGIDVALVQVSGSGLQMQARLLHHHARSYPTTLRQKIFAVRQSQQVGLGDLAELGRKISLAHAVAVRDALQETGLRSGDLAAVAAHGQTLFHSPPNTIQWLDPALIAAEVGCPVVSDFRRADCAAGGQGAPLVPFADYILFRHPQRAGFVINIGGIANFTFLPANATPDQVRALDTGPGNCLSDFLMRESDRAGPGFDRDGQLASRGNPIGKFAEAFFQNDYFTKPGDRGKSTDIPSMILLFQQVRQDHLDASLEDLLATACLLCALGIFHAATGLVKNSECDLILSGGGIENRCIMGNLRKLFPGYRILRTDDFGIPSAAKEALAFALLGAATLDGIPSNIPSATGASRSVVLGSITPK